ncbi:ABC transporter substrate-binding protein [Celeribacter indicus]|uniref:Nitrate/sulfonate/bicarbonate ABC transporter periplasmic protein-like protein n=1 Tax=Celeribacter indicus TaxID=1208324 RepID=A0A0B5E6U0_9RHOB|nr:ABC transporter substrate-binding protein [Celeribacter indicus]AJE49150.1 nitrate/sulfonate/bicarbonate ABC transporter periplasmic protein-like protein [Celeribacter indicus]SDX17626.1 NitT/TauT family transport system substrate-binding protein [Celeribacter indicus]
MFKTRLMTACKVMSVVFTGLAAAAPTAAQDQKVVMSHSTKSFAFLTYFAANTMGYFDDLGLEIEEVRTGSGSKALAAMVSGDADVYLGSTATAFKSREQGVPIKIFAPIVRQLTSSIVVTRDWAEEHGVTKDSPLEEKLAALKGARIAISGPGSGADQAARYVIAEAGFDPDRDVELVAMGNNAATYMSAMQAGQIDGFSTSPPHIHIAEQEVDGVILINMAAGELPALDGYFYIGMMARDGWLEDNPDTAARLAAALKMAMDAVHDPERNAEVGQAVYDGYYSDMDRDLFQRVWEDQTMSVPTTLDMDDQTMRDVIAFYNRFSDQQIDENLISETVTDEATTAATALLE